MPANTLRLHVFSDYTCPFCYIGLGRLLRLREEFTLDIHWCHVELHPRLPECGQAETLCRCQQEQWQQLSRKVQRLREEDGLRFTLPASRAESRRALLLSEAAMVVGPEVFEALQAGIYRAYFHHHEDIGDEAVLQRLALEAGLDAQQVAQAWQDLDYQQRLHQHLYLARQLGIRSAPSYVIGDRVLEGVQPLAVLRRALSGWQRQRTRAAIPLH